VSIQCYYCLRCFFVDWTGLQLNTSSHTFSLARNRHEVRNPISAALSATTFASSIVKSDKPINEEERRTLDENLTVVDRSLRFVSDLMRNILDVHRASSDRMTLNMETVGLKEDVFEPVSSIIYTRDTNFKMEIDCPADLLVHSDKLRLNQIVLNLARNSAKFVTEGFVRLRADTVNGSVCIFVEDSGPGKFARVWDVWRSKEIFGECQLIVLFFLHSHLFSSGIPEEKRDRLFARYQKSLDTLAQGTGVGLNLVRRAETVLSNSTVAPAPARCERSLCFLTPCPNVSVREAGRCHERQYLS